MRLAALLLLTLTTAFFPTALRAQAPSSEAAPRDTARYDAPPITVRAARPRATAGGSSAVVVPLDSTTVRPAPTLEQVLRSTPLVVVRANSRGEAQPALRGGEDRHIAVLVDGVPITLAWDHRSDLSVVPLSAARSLTVHRGFSSVLFGPNALAGAVEIDIARGGQRDAPPPPLVLDAGVDHAGARSAALSSGLLRTREGNTWFLRAGAGHRGSEGAVLARSLRDLDPGTRSRMTADGDRRLNTDVEAFDGFFSLRRVSAGGAWTSLAGTGYRLDRGVAPEAHTSEPRLWRYPFQARGFGALSSGTGMRETPWGRGDLEASLGADVGRTEIDAYDDLAFRTVSGTERDDDRTWTARLLGDHTLGARGDLRIGLTYADVFHEETIDDAAAARYRQRLWSLASETEWRFPVGAPVRVQIGGAADGADTPETADKPALERLWDWAARAGATVVLRDGTLLVHGSSGRRARFPALRELYSGALGRFLENPGLRPEIQWTHEAGATLRHGRGELQLVAFHQRLEDAITRISVATPTGNKFQRLNLGSTTARGLEMLGNVTAGPFATGAHGTLQHVRARDSDGRESLLEYEPAIQGGVWADAPLPLRARIVLEATGTGRQRFIDVDRGDFSTLAPSVHFDLRITRAFDVSLAGPWRRVDAQLAIENLADAAVFDQAGLPRPGRTLRIQARFW